MMRVLNRHDVRDLIEFKAGPCVSMFLPTHPGSREERQDAIRLKNLIGQATDELLDRQLRRSEAAKLVEPLRELQQTEPWIHRSDGLACFCGPDFFRAYSVPLRLEEELFVSDRFHVKPLLPLLRADSRYFVLALSQDDARLFEATRHSIRELELPAIERAELDGVEQVQQYHAHRAPSQGRGATGEAIFHGHGGPDDRSKTDILQYFHRVNRSVNHVLQEQQAPLVLACVGYLAPIYESANSYGQFVKVKVPGSPERWSLDELRRHSWQLVEPHLLQDQQRALKEFERERGNMRASESVRDIVLAAAEGRVKSLFVTQGARSWGRVDPQLQAVHLCDDEKDADEELLDYAARETLANSGDVHVLDDIPMTDSPVAATFRY